MTGIKGRVIRAGAPVTGAYVSLTGASGDFVNEQRTLEEGSFLFHLSPGKWTVSWTAPGEVGKQKEVDLQEGQVADLELEISAAS